MSPKKVTDPMDRFTRNYSIVLGLVVLTVLALWARSAWQPRVWEINRLLEADPVISDYPYRFRVDSLEDGVATLLTPRSAAFPAIRFLQVIYPEMAGRAQDDPTVVLAQQALVDRQRGAEELVQALPDVRSVAWALDVRWLGDHGIQVPTGP